MNKKSKGILLMILFALSYSIMQIFVNLSSKYGIPVMEQIFVRNLVNMCVVFCLIRKKGGTLFGDKKYQPWLIARDFVGFLGMMCFFYALAKGNHGDVTILNKMSPFFITIFASIFLKEHLSKVQIPALIMAFCGVFFIANPEFGSYNISLVVALLSAIASGVSYTMLSYFKDKVDGLTIVMHFSTFCVFASLPFMLNDFCMPTGKCLITLLLVGVFGTLAQVLVTYAYRLAPASEISIYNYSGILFSIIMGYFILNHEVGLNSIIGGGIITAASIMVFTYNRSRSKTQNMDVAKKSTKNILKKI